VKKIINVTKPYLPPLEEFTPLLEDIWRSKILTNNGLYNNRFCKELRKELGVNYVVTFSNATQALIAALNCLDDKSKGEIITTPFTFIATTNAIIWSGYTPVFVDIDPATLNIDVNMVEKAITGKTKAILAVHCYGTPSNVEMLNHISTQYGIQVIYDAAHAFGVKIGEKSVFTFGDMSVISFHATKVMNTFEGGAVACHSQAIRDCLLNFSNFGFQNETTIVSLGLNAKMSEFNAALGILQLKYKDKYLNYRAEIAEIYKKNLEPCQNIFIPRVKHDITSNNAYFPIFIEKESKCDRDEIYLYLREHGYMVRRYFYPLTCDFGIPEIETNSIKHEIPEAHKRSEQVLCLPIYPGLKKNDVNEISLLLLEKLG
jgi:dTDP-4-amino-4,6-dideoxy-D-glucose transaminase